MEVLNNITDFFTGNNNEPANPDHKINTLLLQQAKQKVEIGIFTRFFKKPVLITMEILSYVASIILLIAGVWFFGKIDVALSFIQNGGQILEFFTERNWDTSVIGMLEALLLILSISPSIISCLLGRLFTKARKRIYTMREVEGLIDKVIYNLSGTNNQTKSVNEVKP